MAQEAMMRKADLKQGKLASEAFGRVNTAVKVRLESRLNAGRLIEIEAKLINSDERSDAGKKPVSARALKKRRNLASPAA